MPLELIRSSAPSALALALLLAASPPAVLRAGDEDPQVVLPEGPNARAWSGVGPTTVALDLGEALAEHAPWLLPSEPPRDAAERWRGWGDLVTAEAARANTPLAEGETSQSERSAAARAALALFASEQGRWQDAWVHLERLGGYPEWSAAVLPTLLPGAPLGGEPGVGGLPAPLPDGVLLTPAVPPASGPIRPGRIQPRTASLHGLRIGAATVDFKITIDGSGIEVDLQHTGGEPATVRVLLPEPEGLEIRVEYIDWMRQDELRQPLLVDLVPGEEEHNLFGRFRPRRVPLPASPEGELPRALLKGGLWVEWSGDATHVAELGAAAEVMARTLGVRGGLVRPEQAPPWEPWSPTLLHLPRELQAARRFLAQVASRLEARVLRTPEPR